MNRGRFITKLDEQLKSIRISSNAYDQGSQHEAVRLAVSLRVLFHDSRNSQSLFSHLHMSDTNLLSSDVGYGDWRDYVATVINLASPTPVSCTPKMGELLHSVSYYKRWTGQLIHKYQGREYHRKELILSAANQDGGAHVDAKLEAFYEDLASGTNGFSIDGENLVYPMGAPYNQSIKQCANNTHFAMIRQFAHEILATADHYKWLICLRRSAVVPSPA